MTGSRERGAVIDCAGSGVAFMNARSLLSAPCSPKRETRGAKAPRAGVAGRRRRQTPRTATIYFQRASGLRTDPARQVDRGFQIVTPTLAAGHHCHQPWRCCFFGRSSPLCPPHPNTRDHYHLILSLHNSFSVPASTQLDASAAWMVALCITEFGGPFRGET